MYSDGKLSSFPAGSGLEEHLGSAQSVIDLNKNVLQMVESLVGRCDRNRTLQDDTSASPLAEATKNIGSELKAYDVVHLGTEGIQEFCAAFEAELETRGVNFLWRTRLISVCRSNDGFELHCNQARTGEICYRARNVVLATGKASGTQIRKHYSDIGIEFLDNNIEMGVRVETHRDAIDPLSTCYLDAKLKFSGKYNSEIRTFCVCNGSYLVSCYYDDFLPRSRICTISGFSFKSRQSKNSNFGLLVRKKFPKRIDAIQMQLDIIKSINKASGHDGTVFQRYEDFISGKETNENYLRFNSIISTLPSSTPVDLNWIMPEYVSSNIRHGMELLGQISPGIINADTLLHAPVWELVHDRPVISRDFQTKVPGFYIIGDATGIARGIVQAASTGLWAGRMFTEGRNSAGLLETA